MKFNYRISDTASIKVDVNEKVAAFLADSYRREDNYSRKCSYHDYSYESVAYEGEEFAAPDTPESIITADESRAESEARCHKALSLLTNIQRERILMLISGMSTCEIARREGTNQKSVYESIRAAKKILKLFYGNTP